MRHAYLIMAYTNFDQLGTLLRLLDDDRNDLYLHIDAKTSRTEVPDLRRYVRRSKLTIVEPIPVAWGGYSQVRCEMRLIRAALESGEPYGYLHLLSGADLPIKTNDEICRFLQEHDGKEFIAFVYRNANGGRMDAIKERIALHHPWQERTGRKDDLPTRVLSKAQKLLHVDRLKGSGLKEIGKGSQWFSITAEFGRYLTEQEPLVERTFRSSYCSDELFIQTMVLNSPFAGNLYDPNGDGHGDNLRLIDWERGAPYVFRSQDYDELMASPQLFARKFDERVDSAIIRKIADTLRTR
ncbi:glycoside transferase family protein [Bifidobacterium anseris]|uniref:Peptide O-xylosyltransferase n=1 Tax=Bifidobacterium anseris TaxID=2020963 RepID=A0A2N5IZS9_9BIFI|nr:glycoside transferase family protein [Bifidobacterium anseris]